MASVVILGAGLTGLSAAYHLEQLGFIDYQIFEKDDTVGGLCRSVNQDGFTFDYTGHLLHVSDEYFKMLISNLVGFENFNLIFRRSFIYSHEVYTLYPYQINLYGLPNDVIVECIEGFLKRRKNIEPKTFYSWVLKYFGKGLGENFLFPFEQKKIAYDVKKLMHSWTGRFVPATNLKDMIVGSIKSRDNDSFGYNSQFYYPKTGGISFWVTKLANKLKNNIKVNSEVDSVDIVNKVVKFKDGSWVNYKYLISTIPLDVLLKNIKESSSSNLAIQSKKLLCNSVLNFNLGIQNRDISDKHWIYFPELKYKFYRIGFPHNFSRQLVPENASSLYGEFSYINLPADRLEQITQESIKDCMSLLKIEENEIATKKIINIQRAYVIYDKWRENNLKSVLDKLESYNIFSVGRYGAWKYSSMQEAVLDGKQVAEKIMGIN